MAVVFLNTKVSTAGVSNYGLSGKTKRPVPKSGPKSKLNVDEQETREVDTADWITILDNVMTVIVDNTVSQAIENNICEEWSVFFKLERQ